MWSGQLSIHGIVLFKFCFSFSQYYAVRLASMAADVFVQMSVIVRVGSLRLTVDVSIKQFMLENVNFL